MIFDVTIVTTNTEKIARELELEVEPEDGTELLHLLIKLEQRGSRFLWMSKDSGLELESTPGISKLVEMTTQDLEY